MPDELQRLEHAYANAMWNWSEAENHLFTIYAIACNVAMSEWEPIRHAFFAVTSGHARLDMINAAAKEKWMHSPHLANWNDLYKECKEQTKKRGAIAHLVGSVFTSNKSEPAIVRLTQPMWRPDFPGSYEKAKVEGYSIEVLLTLGHDWEVLGVKIRDFYRQIAF